MSSYQSNDSSVQSTTGTSTTTSTDNDSSSGLVDAITVLLNKCTAQESLKIAGLADLRHQLMRGPMTPNQSLRNYTEKFINESSDPEELKEIMQQCKVRIEQVSKKEDDIPKAEKAQRLYLRKKMEEIIKTCNGKIDQFMSNPSLEMTLTYITDEAIRGAIVSYYVGQGFHISSYTGSGEIKVKIMAYTKDTAIAELMRMIQEQEYPDVQTEANISTK
jgi:hypothetical protein